MSNRHKAVLAGLLVIGLAVAGQTRAVDENVPPAAAPTVDSVDAESRLATAQALLAEDPQAALDLIEPTWLAGEPPRSPELGLAMIEALSKLKLSARVLEIADELGDPLTLPLESRGRLLKLSSNAANAMRRFENLEAAEATLRALQAEGLEKVEAAAIGLSLGNGRLFSGSPAKAESNYRQALRMLGDQPHVNRLALLQNLAVSMAQQARLPEAIETFSEAERAMAQLGQAPTVSFLSNFGAFYADAKDWQRAMEYLQRAAVTSATESVPPAMLARIQANLGVAQNGLGNLAEATRHFERALQISRENGLPQGERLNNLAHSVRSSGRAREALAMFEEALAYSRSENSPALTAVALKNIGETWVELGDRSKAADYLEQAYRAHLATDVRTKRLELYPVMIGNLEALGRTAEALKLLHEFKALSEETTSVESNERVARLESIIDLAKTEQALALSESERLQQEASLIALRAEQQRQQLVAMALGGGVLALVLVALLLYRQVRFRTRANRLLQEKNSEISAQHARLTELNETIRLQSLRDSLTGLPNRRFLEEHMAELTRSQPIAPESPASRGLLLMIDIDHFKRINDTLGHLAGDQALVEVAAALRSCLGPNDVVVRWGGEEFLWLAHGATLDAAAALCRRVQSALRERPFSYEGQAHPITVSMGFAPRPLWPIDGDDWTLSLRVADDALYMAKSTGRNRWVGYAPGSSPPQLPLEHGVLASALEAGGHLVRFEQATVERAD